MTTKKIHLANTELCAIVDEDDFLKFNEFKWYLSYYGYAVSTIPKSGSKKSLLHRLVLNAQPKEIIDHKNGNKLDNRKSNLRLCSQSQNMCNKIKSCNSKSSIYKGVAWHSTSGKWIAQIQFKRKVYYLGLFNSEIDAATHYNEKATQIHGEYAKLNIIEEM